MPLLLHSPLHISTDRFSLPRRSSPALARRRLLSLRCLLSSAALPFPVENAEYHRELQAAIDVVERACRLCVDVKRSLFSNDGGILEKNDETPVTIADFGVQALISLELGNMFPSIPLVAEEDSASIRSTNLADFVVDAVMDKASLGDHQPTKDAILEAIDRGGQNDFSAGPQLAAYWVLDPIDGTRGFLKGAESLYVVGLALVVGGEVVLGVMGCPNWQEYLSCGACNAPQDYESKNSEPGIIMVSHFGCGTWTRGFAYLLNGASTEQGNWNRCFVDKFSAVHEARFCISDSQTWKSIPLSPSFKATLETETRGDEVVLLRRCCGSLCKYMMVASGMASVFILQAETEKTIKAWDHAVGMICVHEAGGKVTDWGGSQINLSADIAERRIIFPQGGVLASNGRLHYNILEIIIASDSSTAI